MVERICDFNGELRERFPCRQRVLPFDNGLRNGDFLFEELLTCIFRFLWAGELSEKGDFNGDLNGDFSGVSSRDRLMLTFPDMKRLYVVALRLTYLDKLPFLRVMFVT